MPVADSYGTVAEYKTVADKTDAADDAQIAVDLAAVSRYIDHELGRFFTRDVADTVRTYQPGDRLVIAIDDLVSATSIQVDIDGAGLFTAPVLAPTDYQLRPLNAPQGAEPRPYTSLWLPAWSSLRPGVPYLTELDTGRRNYSQVKVTGIHGWPAIPPAIKRACIELTRILRIESPRATTRIDEAGNVLGTSRAAQDIVSKLMKGYSRSTSAFMVY